MENSKIEWCDHTFNPWRGCTKVSEGCKNCYADTLSKRNPGTLGVWGPNGTRVVASESTWKQPLKWNKDAEKQKIRPRVFCASLADVFEGWDGCPTYSDGSAVLVCNSCGHWGKNGSSGDGNCCEKCDSGAVEMANLDRMRRRLFALIDATSNLDWLLLTKRPENILSMWPDCAIEPCETLHSDGRKNVWLGTSVENQEYADKRIPALIQCRDLSPVLFLSCEPLLGSLDLNFVRDNPPIDWVIVGGESGPNARPSHPDWFRSIRDQCSAAGVPFHFKQWGEFDEHQKRVGKKAAGRLLDGEEHGHFES